MNRLKRGPHRRFHNACTMSCVLARPRRRAMHYRNDPEGTRLPIKLDTTTNGEFAPIPLAPVHRRARRLALDSVTTNARRLNLTRRSFLVSACGAATALLAMNAAYATGGRRGGYYDLPAAAALDMQVARSEL